jgi:hypothetical protein
MTHMRFLTLTALTLLACVCPVTVQAQDNQLHAVRWPNRISYWQQSGFVEMVPPLRLPTDKSTDDTIQVWLRIPDDGKVKVQWLPDQQRYTLKFPNGTVADRVESVHNEHDAMQVVNGIDDVRGARIGADGRMWFHVYEPVPGQAKRWLQGYAWLRSSSQGDALAGDSLIKLYYPDAPASAHAEMQDFRILNQCALCHVINQPAPTKVPDASIFNGLTLAPGTIVNMMTDADGFFQPITVLTDRMTVRNARPWDLNADDPFITVWCGSQKTTAVANGDQRGYTCPDNGVPIGKLDMPAALEHKNKHALQVCDARKYLYAHMQEDGRKAFAASFLECGIH